MSFTRFSPDTMNPIAPGTDGLGAALRDQAEEFASLFKALGHEGRLLILGHLAFGEKSVGELEELLGQRQAAVSQQLARLRLEGLVTTRREGKAIHYALQDPRVLAILQLLPKMAGAEGL